MKQWMGVPGMGVPVVGALLLSACVTINVYFPAAEAKQAAKDSVPFEAVQLIGVANEPQRDRVRALLDAAGVRTKVAVYPPWFAAPA